MFLYIGEGSLPWFFKSLFSFVNFYKVGRKGRLIIQNLKRTYYLIVSFLL